MGARVAVAGASGYAGGELLRLLASHPDLEIGAVGAGSNAGVPVTAVHPNLITLAGRTFGPTTPEALAGSDLVFMALPHGEAAGLAAQLPEQTKVVDLGAGFRLSSEAAWQRFYGGEHPGTWTYGLPELPGARDKIRAATRVASPGCYATASILALAPLLASGLAEPGDVVVVAASGRPSMRLAFCSAWPAAPLPRLSMAETTTARPARGSATACRWAAFEPAVAALLGHCPSGSRWTNGSPA